MSVDCHRIPHHGPGLPHHGPALPHHGTGLHGPGISLRRSKHMPRIDPIRADKQNIFSTSIESLKLPKVGNKHYKTSYKTDFAKTENVIGCRPRPRPQSPSRCNRPHPINLYYLERLDTKQVVCDVKTDAKEGKIDIIGGPPSTGKMFLRTCTQESFGSHSLSPDSINTRYGSNKHKYSIARGIVPITPKEANNNKLIKKDDHWLPGTCKLTTAMTMQGPFQYLPRKRKQIILDSSAAGMLGGNPPEEHRYHNAPRTRGYLTPKLTIRSGI